MILILIMMIELNMKIRMITFTPDGVWGLIPNQYASAGCQVLVGYPQCQKRGLQPQPVRGSFSKKMLTI